MDSGSKQMLTIGVEILLGGILILQTSLFILFLVKPTDKPSSRYIVAYRTWERIVKFSNVTYVHERRWHHSSSG